MKYLTYNLLSSTVALLLFFLCPFFDHIPWIKYLLAVPFLVAFKYLCAVTIYPAYLSPLRHIPTPKRRMLWGNTPTRESIIHNIAKMVNSEFPHEQLVRYYFYNLEVVIATSPDAVEEVLHQKSQDFPYPSGVLDVFELVGIRGLFKEDGEKHKIHRKVLSKWFSPQSLRQQYSKLVTVCTTLVQSIELNIQSQPDPGATSLIMSDWVSRAAVDAVGSALFDINLGSLRGDGKHHHSLKHVSNSVSDIHLFYASMFFDATWLAKLPFAKVKELLIDKENVELLCSRICQRHGRRLQGRGLEGGPDTIASLSIKDNNFSDREVLEHATTFLATGFETISSGLQWTVYYLCRHPDIQERLRSELQAHLPGFPYGDTSNDESRQVLEGLPYLNAFYNEVFRISPPIVITLRKASRDTTICGAFIPKETIIAILPKHIHKSTVLYGADANEFNPDRWLKPGGPYETKTAFLPFGRGMHSCIAQQFARLEMLCFTAALTSRFAMQLENPNARATDSNGFVCAPSDGVRARLTPLT